MLRGCLHSGAWLFELIRPDWVIARCCNKHLWPLVLSQMSLSNAINLGSPWVAFNTFFLCRQTKTWETLRARIHSREQEREKPYPVLMENARIQSQNELKGAKEVGFTCYCPTIHVITVFISLKSEKFAIRPMRFQRYVTKPDVKQQKNQRGVRQFWKMSWWWSWWKSKRFGLWGDKLSYQMRTKAIFSISKFRNI